MDFDAHKDVSAATVAFEQELERLILESFANGVAVEDTWEITTPLSDMPDWHITIEKRYVDKISTD